MCVRCLCRRTGNPYVCEACMSKKLLLIYNPTSGKAQVKSRLSDIIDVFAGGGYDVTVRPTQGPDDAYNTTCEKAGCFDLLVVCGGDGTLNECVRGLLTLPPGNRKPLGYIPAGSTNDFASTLGIPKNLVKAAQNVLAGKPFACDAGRFNEGNFVYIAAFGAFTDVSYDTPQKFKNIFGHAAYLLEGIRRLPNIKPSHIRVNYGDGTIEGDYILGMVTNTRSVGGFKDRGGLGAKLDDGLFEVILFKNPNNPIELQNMVADFMKRNFSSPYCHVIRASHAVITAQEPIGWTLDGENLPQAFTAIAGAGSDVFDS